MSQEPPETTTAVTDWLLQLGAGGKGDLDAMLPLVYDELHRLAEQYLSRSAKRLTSRYAPSLVACMWAKSSTGRTQPVRAEISTTSSSEPRSRTRPITSTPNGTARPFPFEPLAQRAELLHDGGDRVLAGAAEEKAGVKHDDLGPAGSGNAGAAVERAHRRREFRPLASG